jgi:hypothetical protein
MIDIDKEQAVVRQYLLRRLDEEGQQHVEERFLTDSDFREAVLVIEDELIEDYLAGLLDDDEQESFINHYMSAPRQLEEVRLSQVLREHTTREQEEEDVPEPSEPVAPEGKHKILSPLLGRGWLPVLATAVILLAVLAVSWNLIGKWSERDPQAARNAEVAQLNNANSAGELDVTVRLPSSQSRGPQQTPVPKVSFSGGTNVVQLLVNLPRQPYQRYEATLRENNGPEVFTVGSLHVEDADEGRLLKLRIPARFLPPEDYILNVRGVNDAGQHEDVAEYFFRVVK